VQDSRGLPALDGPPARAKQEGKPTPPGMDFRRLPKIICFNCKKTILYGYLPPRLPGKPLMVQCTRDGCGVHNYLEED
jgi:hypothetical protein